ncbi:MAG: SNF2-related protein [bacterium]
MGIKKADKKKKKEKEKKKKKAQAKTKDIIADHYIAAEWARRYDDKKSLIFHLKKILNIKPNAKDALMWMAEIEYNSKKYLEATHYFERAKKAGTDWPFLEFFLGLAYFFSDTRLDLAQKNLNEFIKKTARKKKEEITEKRKTALYYYEFIKQRQAGRSKADVTRREKGPAPKERKEKANAPEEGSLFEVKKASPAKTEDYCVDVHFSFSSPDYILDQIRNNQFEDKSQYDLRLEYFHISLLRGYDELLCLDTLKNVDQYWYQIETVKRVLKYYRGRVLLADEVGLGKTIEACMLIKEYLLRRMINRVLVLTPTSLVSQWQEELSGKFGLEFATTDQEEFRENESFWTQHPLIVASINIAKSKKNFEKITQIEHDLVVVDEAHHMRNRSTLNWKLVNSLKKRFIFLISATPVQNNLIELFNLITLLKPGFLKTQSEFRNKYMAPGKPKMPKNSDTLRELLREVMIRNTRSLIDVRLPNRFASTITVSPSPLEKQIYERVSCLVREWFEDGRLDWFTLTNLQMRAGSALDSLEEILGKIGEKGEGFHNKIKEVQEMLSSLKCLEKKKRLLDLIRKKPEEKKIIFVHYLKTLYSLAGFLAKERIPFVEFRGSMSNAQKDKAINDFRENTEILLATEVGGEGRNMQFCRTIINYDLPWNPMRIEQRIGRVHRIGQTNDVFVFNFCMQGSIEEYILDILDKKINMFELVIGEIDNILGNLDEEAEFSDIVMDIWARSKTKEDLNSSFKKLGDKILEAKKEYQESKELDESLLASDYVV